jgi:6,7-dimethyl-8-ribityllumazine synthase
MSGTGKNDNNILDAKGLRVAIVAARWNEQVIEQVVDCAVTEAKRHGVTDITIEHVDGSGELAAGAQILARSGAFDAIVAIGIVARGGTTHFETVTDRATAGLLRVALDEGVPIGDAVIAVYDMGQARARAGGPGSDEDKGAGAMHAALDLALLKKKYKS